ncbi:MAG: hypothetical protein HKN82_03215 [Akkermansiaceae bacterium]|nr:hypothetical protein [Akkermansiaceae bacterium]NNM31410.1 hypothetical protein [Akkermansiaceae bacterium]
MRILPIIALGSILLCSCGEEEGTGAPGEAPAVPAAEGWPVTTATDGGSYTVTVNPVAGGIEQNKHFALDVTVVPKDAAGGEFTVKVDADMPAHRHGMNTQPEVAGKEAGRYQVDGMLFHMAGEWVIMVDVTRDGKTERASVPVNVE